MAIALKEDREVRGIDAILKRPDGTLVPFLPYPTPLHDTDGRLAGAVNVLVDISQHKQHERTQRLLFSELNHRVKNNVQMLHALLNASVREASNAEAREVIKQAAQKVAAISAAQRALYQANLASQVEARPFLEAICECMREALPKGVAVQCLAQDFAIANDATVPLALIINELVTNAGKYAIDAGGEARVLVELSAVEQRCLLRVTDSGAGWIPEQSHKRASGLGLVRGLVAQLAGSMSLEPGSGAPWTISFPLNAISTFDS
jgi:two-component sensor histidine kinase